MLSGLLTYRVGLVIGFHNIVVASKIVVVNIVDNLSQNRFSEIEGNSQFVGKTFGLKSEVRINSAKNIQIYLADPDFIFQTALFR